MNPVVVKNVCLVAGDPEFYLKEGLVSCITLPVIVKNEAIGVLSLYTKEEHNFTQEEIESLATIVGQAAIAIHEAKLYEETERRRSEAEELAHLAQFLAETRDTKAVGERIVQSVQELFDVKGSTLRLMELDGSLRSLASAGEIFSQKAGGDIVAAVLGSPAAPLSPVDRCGQRIYYYPVRKLLSVKRCATTIFSPGIARLSWRPCEYTSGLSAHWRCRTRRDESTRKAKSRFYNTRRPSDLSPRECQTLRRRAAKDR